jgi:hypothetical protein
MYFGRLLFSGYLIVCAGMAYAPGPNVPPHQQYSVGDIKSKAANQSRFFRQQALTMSNAHAR